MQNLTCTIRLRRRGAHMHLDDVWHSCMFRLCILLLPFSTHFANYHRISSCPSALIVRRIDFVVALEVVVKLLEWTMQMQAKDQLMFSSFLLHLINVASRFKETSLVANGF